VGRLPKVGYVKHIKVADFALNTVWQQRVKVEASARSYFLVKCLERGRLHRSGVFVGFKGTAARRRATELSWQPKEELATAASQLSRPKVAEYLLGEVAVTLI
jgi:hypothetical protein